MVCRSGPKTPGAAGGYRGSDVPSPRLSNWNGNLTFAPDLLRTPADLPSLVEAVAEATEQGKSLHVIGSGWSYEDCASADQVMVSLSGMLPSSGASPRITEIVGDRTVLTDEWNARQKAVPNSLVHYPAGITLVALIADLATLGLSLPTIGGSDGQTLGGAISTSVHGGDWSQPPICDIVRAVHLVAAGGQEYWIESASKPLTESGRYNAALLDALPCPTTQVIRDDNVFNAVRVACGRFGIIVSVVLEVVPQFRVVQLVTKPTLTSVLLALRQGQGSLLLFIPLLTTLASSVAPSSFPDATGLPYTFQVNLNSQRPTDVWVTRRWVTPSATTNGLPDFPAGGNSAGDILNANRVTVVMIAKAALLGLVVPAGAAGSALAAALAGVVLGPLGSFLVAGVSAAAATEVTRLCADLDILLAQGAPLGDIAAAAVNALFKVPGAGSVVADIAEILIDSNIQGGKMSRGAYATISAGKPASYYGADSIEVVFDAATSDYLDFLDEIIAIAPQFPQAGYISLRPSLPSDALLSMHNVGSRLRAVSIEIASLRGLAGNASWISFVEQRAIAHKGKPHWGEINTLDASKVAMMYGHLNDWREALYRVNGAANVFSNNYTRQRGLEPMGIIRQVTCVVTDESAITHLGAGGQYWSPIPLQQALNEIIVGRVTYFVHVGMSAPAVLTTTSSGGLDAASEALLLKLPICSRHTPPVDLGPERARPI